MRIQGHSLYFRQLNSTSLFSNINPVKKNNGYYPDSIGVADIIQIKPATIGTYPDSFSWEYTSISNDQMHLLKGFANEHQVHKKFDVFSTIILLTLPIIAVFLLMGMFSALYVKDLPISVMSCSKPLRDETKCMQ